MNLIADVFITTKGRSDLYLQTLCSLVKNTERTSYRLTVVYDGFLPMTEGRRAEEDTLAHLGLCPPDYKFQNKDVEKQFGRYVDLGAAGAIDYRLFHLQNEGLGPSLNQALAHIDSLNRWGYDHMGQKIESPRYVCYVQDDVLFAKDWLQHLKKVYEDKEEEGRLIGFASGHYAVEHESSIRERLPDGNFLMDYIRATCMFAPREYWMSMWPIPAIDKETGRLRGKPNDGLGSGVDWYFVRQADNSVCKTGRTNIVIPELITHVGFNRSTWLDRALSESPAGIRKIIQNR